VRIVDIPATLEQMPFLSVIIPAYNEERRLLKTLNPVREYLLRQDFDYEVVLVNDGSKDGTQRVAEEFAKTFPALKVLTHSPNRGKGGAVKRGMLESTGQWRLFMDADNSTPLAELDKFLPHLSEADVLIGSRYLKKDSIKIKQPWKRRVGSRGFNFFVQQMLLPGIVDTQCGFKLFSAAATEAIFPLQSLQRWSFDVELLTIANQLGFRILEIPVDWYDDSSSRLNATRTATSLMRDLRKIRRKVKGKEYAQARVK